MTELAKQKGIPVDLSAYQEDKALHSLGFNLNRLMLEFERVVSLSSVDAFPLEPLLEAPDHQYLGAAVVFERATFRTKDVRMPSKREAAFLRTSNSDPHIYLKAKNKWRFVLPIDPRWITTNTAFVLFRTGAVTFSGLARITNLDSTNKILFGTPWVIGIPPGPLDDWSG